MKLVHKLVILACTSIINCKKTLSYLAILPIVLSFSTFLPKVPKATVEAKFAAAFPVLPSDMSRAPLINDPPLSTVFPIGIKDKDAPSVTGARTYPAPSLRIYYHILMSK